MSSGKSIRVIKREQRESMAEGSKTDARGSQGLRDATREMAGSVSAWVKEFKERSRHDPRRAFAGLFAEPATTLNSLS